MKFQAFLIFVIIPLAWSCFGPIDPTHPLDKESPISQQATASLNLTLTMPVVDELQGYISLVSSHSEEDPRRLYLEDFNFKGSTTTSDGENRQLYSYAVNNLKPGIYALYPRLPNFQLKTPSLFQLNPNSDLSLALELEVTP